MDILQRDDLAFPRSLPEFQQQFPNDAACAAYLELACWPDGFTCRYCGAVGEPFRIVTRPGVLECRSLPSPNRPSGWHGDGAEPYAAQHMVLGCLFGRQSDARHVGGAVPAATRPDPLRDGLRHPAQAACRHGATRSGPDRWHGGRTCRGGRNLCWRKDTRRGPGRPPQDAGGRCRRSPPPEAGHGSGQSEGWPICWSRSPCRSP